MYPQFKIPRSDIFFHLLYPHYHNPLLITNHSWILTINKGRIKPPWKNVFDLQKVGLNYTSCRLHGACKVSCFSAINHHHNMAQYQQILVGDFRFCIWYFEFNWNENQVIKYFDQQPLCWLSEIKDLKESQRC